MAVWNVNFVMRGYIEIEADTEEEAMEIFSEMDDETINNEVKDTDIVDIWEVK